jgi:hypothetical protein
MPVQCIALEVGDGTEYGDRATTVCGFVAQTGGALFWKRTYGGSEISSKTRAGSESQAKSGGRSHSRNRNWRRSPERDLSANDDVSTTI